MSQTPASAVAAAPEPQWRRAEFFHREGNVLRCTLCPFACGLLDGTTGRCRVRRRRGDQIQTATFATSVWHLQPVERKPLFHVRPGQRVLTVAAPGCTFACTYCQNHQLSQYGRLADRPWSAQPLEAETLVAAAVEARAGIALSYSEPVLAAELTLALSPRARGLGVELMWKTNGFLTPQAARRVAPALTAVNVDLKAADDDAHRALTGAPLGPVLAALALWKQAGMWIELSVPLIPGFNTDEGSLRAIAAHALKLGPATPVHLLRFHPDHKLVTPPPTGPDLLSRARALLQGLGLQHVYVERALGQAGRDTRCPRCQAVVVSRPLPWEPGESRLVAGACPSCATPIAGLW